MVKIKGWKKVSETNLGDTWVGTNNRVLSIQMQDIFNPDNKGYIEKGYWVVSIYQNNYLIHKKKVKSLKEGRNIAVDYMRSNPNG